MKVLVNGLSNSFGGVESLFLNIIKNVCRDELQIDFICLHDKAANEEEFLANGAVIYHVGRISGNTNGFKKELRKIIKNGGYDIYHVNLTRFGFPVDISVASECGLKIILHSHSTHIYKSGNFKVDLIRKLEFALFKRYYISKADMLLACSTNAGEYLFKNNKFIVLYNGIDYRKCMFNKTKRNTIRNEFEITKDDFVIGHIGRFQDEKNQLFIIKVMERLVQINEKYKVILIGEGKDIDLIKEEVKKRNLCKNVIFAGFRADAYDVLSAMDLFVLPSKHEALPLSLIEAQVNGLKCLTSPYVTSECDLTEISRMGINDNDAEKWANEIIRNDNCRIMDENYCPDEKFDLNTFCTKLKELYKELI